MTGSIMFKVAGRTDTGIVRKVNEDSVLVRPAAGLLGVADGMGGVAGGAFASAKVLEQASACADEPAAGLEDRLARYRQAMALANLEIRAWAENQGVRGTGSTVILMVFDPSRPDHAALLHAGDSRAYLCRAGALRPLTRDHSVAESFGDGTDESVPAAFRSVVTNAVGMNEDLRLEETLVPLRSGDVVLLCSDGLYRMVKDHEMARLLQSGNDLELVAESLVRAANANGGKDNISVVLARLDASAEDAPGGMDPETRETDVRSALEAAAQSRSSTRTATTMASVVHGEAPVSPDVPASDRTPAPARSRWVWLAAGLAAGAVLLVLLAMSWSRRERTALPAATPETPILAAPAPVEEMPPPADRSPATVIESARSSGDWSEIARDPGRLDGAGDPARIAMARAWADEWSRAFRDPVSAWNELDAVRQSISQSATGWAPNLSLPALEPGPPTDPADAASRCCLERRLAQEVFFQALDDYMAGALMVVGSLGPDPAEIERNLRAVSGQRLGQPAILPPAVNDLRSRLRALNRWKQDARELPIGAVEVNNVTSVFIAPVDAGMLTLLGECYRQLSAMTQPDEADSVRPAVRSFHAARAEALAALSGQGSAGMAQRESLAAALRKTFRSSGLEDLAAVAESNGGVRP